MTGRTLSDMFGRMRHSDPATMCHRAGHYLAAVAICLLVGCAAKPAKLWENPALPRDEWPIDNSECRRLAERKIDQEIGANELDRAPDNIAGPGAYQRNVNRADAARRQAQLFSACMTERGYRPLKRQGS